MENRSERLWRHTNGRGAEHTRLPQTPGERCRGPLGLRGASFTPGTPSWKTQVTDPAPQSSFRGDSEVARGTASFPPFCSPE